MSEPLELADRALELAGAEQAEVVVTGERSGFARYAAGEIHQPTLIDNVVVQLRIVSDGRSGVAVTNRTDDEGLADLGRRAAEASESASPDPDLAPLAPPAALREVEGYDEATARLESGDQARLAEAAIAGGGDFGL
jgi:predicted Zn-dependent protease